MVKNFLPILSVMNLSKKSDVSCYFIFFVDLIACEILSFINVLAHFSL